MRKLLALALALMVALFCAACGGKTFPSLSGNGIPPADPGAWQQNLPTTRPNNQFSNLEPTSTARDVLAMFGLTEADIISDCVKAVKLVSGNEKSGEISLTVSSDSSLADFNAWGESLFNKTLLIAKDGKAYSDIGEHDDVEMTAFTPVQTEQVSAVMWAYYRDNDLIIITLFPDLKKSSFRLMLSK